MGHPQHPTQHQVQADDHTWRPAEGTWQVSGHSVPRRLVWAVFPAVRAAFPAGPTAGLGQPPQEEAGLPPRNPPLMGGVGGHLALAQPGQPPIPCFVHRVWNVLGHGARLPGGDTCAIALISLLDRFLLHSSPGLGRLPATAAARPGPSVSVPALAARSVQLGVEGFPREAPSACLRGPWARLPIGSPQATAS